MGVNEYALERLAADRLAELRAAAEAARLASTLRAAARRPLAERARLWLSGFRRAQGPARLTGTPAGR